MHITVSHLVSALHKFQRLKRNQTCCGWRAAEVRAEPMCAWPSAAAWPAPPPPQGRGGSTCYKAVILLSWTAIVLIHSIRIKLFTLLFYASLHVLRNVFWCFMFTFLQITLTTMFTYPCARQRKKKSPNLVCRNVKISLGHLNRIQMALWTFFFI